MIRHGRRWLASAVCVAAAAVACSSPPPVASNAIPPPAAAEDKPVVWAALGGDETLTSDPQTAPNAWTQRVLSRLPASAQLLNVATEDATIQTGLTSQLQALNASQVKPTVATVWFGTAEPNTPKDQFADGLTNLVNGLKAIGVQRIVLVARPDTTGDRGYRYGSEIEAVAKATGATYIPAAALATDPREPAVQAAIADQLGPTIS